MGRNSENKELTLSIYRPPPSFTGGCLEIRLFYVRITPCHVDALPDHLTLHHPRRELGVSLEINGTRIPSSDAVSISLRRDRVDKDSSEVTYVSTDSVKVSGSIEFEVLEQEKGVEGLILCGSLMRDCYGGDGWSMDCYVGASVAAVFRGGPSIEVYIAGCCSGSPVILTKTVVVVSPKKKALLRQKMLDAIPEDEEIGKEDLNNNNNNNNNNININGFVRQRKLQLTETGSEDYESDEKYGHGYYSEEMYSGEDGQLTFFNAGVRVGVGIGLGMCLGVGIGVGLLMRSYQATTRNFRRRFF